MLEMSSRLAVAGLDSPAVGHQPDVAVAHSHHRFDGDTHGSLQHAAITAPSVIRNLRIFVHLTADAMTSQFTHDSITFGFAMVLDSTADITQMISSNGGLYTEIKTLFGGLQQFPDFLADLSHPSRSVPQSIETISPSRSSVLSGIP